MAALTVHD